MFKKILKVGSLAAAGYVAYKVIENQMKDAVEVEPIAAEDIIEMLKDKGLKVLLGYDQRVVHFINDDKTVAIKARLNENNEVFLIEYYSGDTDFSTFEIVYPESVISDNENSQKALLSFRRLLGSVGTSEERFLMLIKEIIKNPNLADLSI